MVFIGIDGLWGGWGSALTSKVMGFPLLITIRIQESPGGSDFHLLALKVRLGERKLPQGKLRFVGGWKR